MNISLKKVMRVFRAKESAPCLVEPEFVNPTRDWFVGLLGVIVCFCVGIAYIVYDFNMQVGADQDITLDGVDVISYPERDVLRYADIYKEKQAAFDALRTAAPLRGAAQPTPNAEPLADAEDAQYTDPVVE